MGNLVLAGSTSGSTTITPSATGTYTITLPAETGTIQTSGAGFTTNGVAYASSTSALTTGSALKFDGTTFTVSQANGTYGVVAKSTSATTSARTYYTIKDSASSDLAYYGFVTSSDLCVWNGQNTNTLFLNNGAELMRLTSAGNLGLGATPKAWASFTAMEIPNNCFWASYSGDKDSYLGVNLYFDGASWIYTATMAASFYRQTTGQHQWFTAPSGTINTAATVTNRMTLDNSGNLGIGTSSPSRRLHVYASSGAITSEITTTANSTQIGFVNPNGGIGSVTTSGSATAYNTSSDYRLKENITSMTGALAKVAQLKPVTYKWKVDGTNGEGFIAHELAEFFPDAVSGEKDAVDADGNPSYQGIDTSFLVATLTSAIQELSTLITAQQSTIQSLTERITALEGART